MTTILNHSHAQAVDDPSVSPAMVEHLLFEVKRLIVGQDHLLERLLVALLARGHVLLEGVPGLAKTATVKALAQVVGGMFWRVQFTTVLVPAELVGSRVAHGWSEIGRQNYKSISNV